MALLPRLSGLADFITTDEAYHWITRTERFSAALAAANWRGTLPTGHPGVSLLWLASAGLATERWAQAQGWITAAPGTITHLAWLRWPAALIESLAVPLAFVLLRKSIGSLAAFFATLLWAVSPYLVAHGRLLHLDGLLTTFVTLSLLALLAQPEGWRSLALSGVFAGLALLTKGPALILLPFAAVALWALGLQRGFGVFGAAWWAIQRYAMWLGLALLVVVLLWPVLWVDPGWALGRYVAEIAGNGGRPNGDGQFFFGQAYADPGPLFYPFADLMRSTPALLLGFGAALIAGVGTLRRGVNERMLGLLLLGGFALWWTLVMTAGPKKFDRYVLPTWPSLCVLAGAGLAWLAQPGRGAAMRRLLLGVALLADVLLLPWYHPYYLSYYNPLFGGGATAEQTLLIGWGEGMDQVGAWLRAQPDAEGGPVLSALPATLRPFVSVPVKDVFEYGDAPANYAVVYLESVQRAADPALYATLQQTVPLHTVTIHGINYARIYQLPRPFAEPVGALFADSLLLRGVTLQADARQISIIPAWDVRAAPAADYQMFIHVLDTNGQRVAQADLRPGGNDGPPTSTWQPGRQIAVPVVLPVPPEAGPGPFRVVAGLYTADGARVPFAGVAPADQALSGGNAVLLGEAKREQ